MKRFKLDACFALVGGIVLLTSSFACGPSESADTAQMDQASMPVAAQPAARIDLGTSRETAPAAVFYPVPLGAALEKTKIQ
jgi:hypothetical protein